MAKRKRNKFDETSGEKAIKIIGATSATIAGVASFRSSKLGVKFMSEYFPAAQSIKNTINSSLRESIKEGRLKASDIDNALLKGIGNINTGKYDGSALREALKESERNRDELSRNISLHKFGNATGSGLLSDIEEIARYSKHASKSNSLNKVDPYEIKRMKQQAAREILKEEKITIPLIDEFKDKYSENQIRQLVDSMYVDIEDAFGVINTPDIGVLKIKNPNYKAGHRKKFGIPDDDFFNKIVKKVAEGKESIEKEVSTAADSSSKEFDKKMEEILKSEDFINYSEKKRDSGLLGYFRRKFEIDKNTSPLRIGDLTEEQLTQLENVSSDPMNLGSDINEQRINLGQKARELKNKKGFENKIIDKSLRITDDGRIYSTFAFDDYIRSKRERFSSTIIGKILYAGIDFEEQMAKPNIKFLSSNKYSVLEKEMGKLKTPYLYAAGKAYKIPIDEIKNKDGSIEFKFGRPEEVAKDVVLINQRKGKSARLMESLYGTDREYITSSDNELFKKFDLFQGKRKSLFSNSRDFLNEKSDHPKNVIKRIKSIVNAKDLKNIGLTEEGPDLISVRQYEDLQKFRGYLDIYTSKHQIDDETAFRMLDALKTETSEGKPIKQVKILKKDFNLLFSNELSQREIMQQLSLDQSYFDKNGKLFALIEQYKKNPVGFNRITNIKSAPETKIPIIDLPMSETAVFGPSALVRNAMVEEVMGAGLKENAANTLFSTSLSFLELNINTNQQTVLDAHLMKYLMDKKLNFEEGRTLTENRLNEERREATNFILGTLRKRYDETIKETFYSNEISNRVLDAVSDEISLFTKQIETDKYINELKGASEVDDYGVVFASNAKNIIPQLIEDTDVLLKSFVKGDSKDAGKNIAKNLIHNINETIKEASIGGRNRPEYMTPITMAAEYSLARLSYGVEEAGLGLSAASMASPLETAKNIMTKRVIPAMLIYNSIDYLNDEAREITGTSFTGAAANVMANSDLALRNVMDHTGIGYIYDSLKNTSVFGEYWTGSTDYQNRDEREEWYRTGESVVRKSRFWSFGSSSEFRGTSIQYYQPNYLRRAHSNWKDVGLYGATPMDKWLHSPIPSLRYPFSPLVYLMDPYWLEKKNNDMRPYPLTRKMFTEGTPWGAVLNPTIGELIKPQKMLRENRIRMVNGRDAKAMIRQINDRIKQKDNKNEDMVIVDGTSIKNAQYVPYGQPTHESFNVSIVNGKGQSPGLDYMDTVRDISSYSPPNGEQMPGTGFGEKSGDKSVPYRSKTRKRIDAFFGEIFGGSQGNGSIGKSMIQSLNEAITSAPIIRNFANDGVSGKGRAQTNLPGFEEGTYINKNLVRDKNISNAEYYTQMYTNKDVSKSVYTDYGKDIKRSISQLGGIYGFVGESLFGSDYNSYRYENAGQMASFSRGFWDASIGSIGGDLMEISRRFFPPQDRSRVDINPLINEMPDWLPRNYRFGDPFVKIPKGEMRLPGRGYETINDLHPDQYSSDGYGAFDRFKILADIATYSDEFKIWRNIARNSVKDPELIAEMDEIDKRVAKKSGDHEFFNYRYINNDTIIKDGVVKNINIKNNSVQLVSGEEFTLAGIKSGEKTTPEEFYKFIKPGDKIHYRTTKDPSIDIENMAASKEAVVYKDSSALFLSRNINQELMQSEVMEKDEEATSALAYMATSGTLGQALGGVQELIAHAPIPFVHNKFFKIESPLESYKREQVYGSSFATWDHPIEGFIKPIFSQSFGMSATQRLISSAFSFYYFEHLSKESLSKSHKFWGEVLQLTLEPASFLMGATNWAKRLNNGFNQTERNFVKTVTQDSRSAFRRGAKAGAIIGTVGWGLANANNPFMAAASFGIAAGGIAEYFKDTGDVVAKHLSPRVLNGKFFKGEVTHNKLAIAGATIGLGVSAIRNLTNGDEGMFDKWKPKKARKIAELDERFDRMEYIKYEGLYKDAVRRAALYEKSNIGYIFKEVDKNKKKIGKLRKKAAKLSNKYMIGSPEYNSEMRDIQQRVISLEEPKKIVFSADGKYTKAAIAYKQAMDSTIYGLNAGSSRSEIMSAIPNQHKDYFMAFMKESNKKKQKEILKYVPEYLHKPLQISWGEDYDEKSNFRYFGHKNRLPRVSWKGWKPNINMDHVKMKTIESEGMLLSDFGYYESEKSKAQYQMAPTADEDSFTLLGSKMNLIKAANGVGMPFSNISIEKSSTPGINIVSSINQTAKDAVALTGYGISSATFGLL